MADQLYELIFSGELVSNIEPSQVQANVAKLFKASPTQIAHLFSGKRVVLKNALPISTGKKYLAALKKAGALCQLVDMQTGRPYGEQPQAGATQPQPTPPKAVEQPLPTSQPQTTAKATLEPGSEHRVGGRPELDAPGWEVAPSGSKIQDDQPTPPLPEPDTDYLSLAPQKGNIVEPDSTPPPPAPDTSHLNLIDSPNTATSKK